MDWVRFFHIVTPNDLHKLIDNDTEVIICEIEFLRKAATLLNATDDRIKTNYIMWRIVHSWVKILDMRFDDIKQVSYYDIIYLLCLIGALFFNWCLSSRIVVH